MKLKNIILYNKIKFNNLIINMELIFKFFYFISIFSLIISEDPEKVYFPNGTDNYNEETKYYPMDLPGDNYSSTYPCVTVNDLIAFHYTETYSNVDNSQIYPENFCYGILNYNITREDFFNIMNKNYNAFQNFKKMLPYYFYSNFTNHNLVDDGCVGYYKRVACLAEFLACDDQDDGTFTVHPICKSVCVQFKRRCGRYFIGEMCNKNSSHGYCPGKSSDKASFLQINYIIFITLFLMESIL
jgi:hypothetical protein